jgi:hypothetical protein
VAQKVILHVGAPKTGTSFLQDLLFSEREALKETGLLYPAEEVDTHLRAALDLMQLPWGGLEREATGAWDHLADQVRAWPGTAIVSHEILATASRVQVARALESLGAGSGTEIHLVYSARDLVRQIPAEWQENLKRRRTTRYAQFLEQILDPERVGEVAQWFWGVQEIPDVLDRWGSTLPRKQVHLVTVPPPRSPRSVMWDRFTSVIGIDPERFQPHQDRANVSLGVPEAALLRRFNEAIEDVVWNHSYRPLVREYLVHRNLSYNTESARLAVPPKVWDWAHDLSRRWVAEVALRGYDVVGSLDDLIPVEPPLPFVDPDDPDPESVADVAIQALAEMTREAARLRDEENALHGRIDALTAQVEAAHSTKIYKAKERLVKKADSSRTAALGLAAYRKMLRRGVERSD